MRELDLFAALRVTLPPRVQLALGMPMGYKMRWQSTQQARPSEPTVFFANIGVVRYGWPGKNSRWIDAQQKMLDVEEWRSEMTVQVSAQLPQDAVYDVGSITPNDAVQTIAAVMQNDGWLQAIKAYGMQVLRISQIRNMPYKNDRDQWEYVPMFDAVLCYTDITTAEGKLISQFEFKMYPVPEII